MCERVPAPIPGTWDHCVDITRGPRHSRSHWPWPPPKTFSCPWRLCFCFQCQEAGALRSCLVLGVFLQLEKLDFVATWNLLRICFSLEIQCIFLIRIFLDQERNLLWPRPWESKRRESSIAVKFESFHYSVFQCLGFSFVKERIIARAGVGGEWVANNTRSIQERAGKSEDGYWSQWILGLSTQPEIP
jgi:hypothetical protein